MISNKKKGSNFEKDFAEFLASRGYWVHLVAGSDYTNSQFADIIACKNNRVHVIDCKVLENSTGTFPLSRFENNQRSAYERFLETGNYNYFLAILWQNDVYFCNVSNIDYKNKKSFNVKDFVIIKRNFYTIDDFENK